MVHIEPTPNASVKYRAKATSRIARRHDVGEERLELRALREREQAHDHDADPQPEQARAGER